MSFMRNHRQSIIGVYSIWPPRAAVGAETSDNGSHINELRPSIQAPPGRANLNFTLELYHEVLRQPAKGRVGHEFYFRVLA